MATKRPPADVSIHAVDSDEIAFSLRGCNTAIVNAIRATAMEHVDKLAIFEVLQFESPNCPDVQSVPIDLVARLKLVPLDSACVHYNVMGSTADRRMRARHDCACSYPRDSAFVPQCKDCAVVFVLAATNPPDATDYLHVYGSAIECVSGHGSFVTAPDLHLWSLMPGESLSLMLAADVSRGICHAAYSPVTCVRVHPCYTVDVLTDVEDLMQPKQRAYTASACQTGAIGFDVESQRIVVRDASLCIGCGACTSEAQIVYTASGAEKHVNPMRVNVAKSLTTRMHVETDGTLDAALVVLEALRQLKCKLAECLAGVALIGDDEHPREFSPQI